MQEIKEETLLEPSKVYDQLKDIVHNNAIEYFNEMIKKSGTDEPLNTKLCDQYYAKQKELEEAKKKATGNRGLKTFLIILTAILFFVAAFVFIASLANGFKIVPFIIALVLIAGGIFCIVMINTKIKNAQKLQDELVARLEREVAELRAKIDPTVQGLMGIYDWGMPQAVIRKSAPLIQLDSYLDVSKYAYMVEKYGLIHNGDKHSSIFTLQSGSIKGNPFFLERNFDQTDGYKTYSNSIVIHWTTYIRDSKGNSQAVHHTQTLTGTVSKPCPYYGFETYLVYCNDAGPNLNFSRKPTVDKNASEKKIAKMVAKDDKKMDKVAEKALNDDDSNTNFTEMNNTEFESLFHAWDRDNEVEFRLLFTPLAQNNMINLLKMKQPFGDDFAFTKRKRINVIRSEHDQHLDFEADPTRFYGFDVRVMRDSFVQYTDYLFKSIYFDIAPLLSIPLYQQMKPIEYIYKDVYQSNVSFYEHEVAANAFNQNVFKPEGAATPCILKTKFNNKNGETDSVTVTAYAFRTVSRIEVVTKMGGDGRLHNIPVEWLEYIPIQKTSTMQVRHLDMSLSQYRNAHGGQNFTSIFRNQIEAFLGR